MRCFIAIELPAEWRRSLAAALRDAPAGRGARWCTPDQLHVTLKFLGDVAEPVLPRVCDAIAAAAVQVEPFEITLGGVGGFPTPRNPRVLWCGVGDPAQGCKRWLRAADPLFEALGFAPEARAYTPHITLARSKSRDGSALLRRAADEVRVRDAPACAVRELVLFESRLAGDGARYIPIARSHLGGGSI